MTKFIGYKPHQYPVNFSLLLDQVNRVRIALAIGEGKLEALPPGRVGHAEQCVLARALSNGWQVEVSNEIAFQHPTADLDSAVGALRSAGFDAVHLIHSNVISMKLTKTMSNFINRFDEEQFPDLILED